MPYMPATLGKKDEPGPDGRVAIIVQFTGAGEETKQEGYSFDGMTTVAILRAWAHAKAITLSSKTIADALAEGMSVTLTPPTPPTPTAEQVWRAKVSRYLAAKELALTDAIAVSNRDALFTDIHATYLPAYLQESA